MDSREPEELNNTETEEGTVALQKKRSRRVSFAEITSVHVFDRDEDFETPPDPKPSSGSNTDDNREANDEVLGFFRELGSNDDSSDCPDTDNGNEDDNDDEIMDVRKSFFRSIDSPSPGSTIGSALSNDDEDNFFGPVSASFIRPGRYSDSGVSEDDNNHDLTMDSSAFSMHFRSLARSESGGDLNNTPLETSIPNPNSEQKTKTPESAASHTLGSFMVLTGDNKKHILQSPVSLEKNSHSKDSNDMSLVGENPRKYDFAKLSPRFDELLSEGSMSFPSSLIHRPKSPSSLSNKGKGVSIDDIDGNGFADLKFSVDKYPVNHGFNDRSSEAACVAHTEGIQLDLGWETFNDAFKESNMKEKSPNIHCGILSDIDNKSIHSVFSAKHESRYLHSSGGWVEDDSSTELRNHNHINSNQKYQSSLVGSMPSLSAKQKVFLDSAQSHSQARNLTPARWPGSFLSEESLRHSKSMSSIQKSISKLNMIRNSPYISTLPDGNDKSRRKLSNILSNPSFDPNTKDTLSKYVDVPIARLEEQFSIMDWCTVEHESVANMDIHETETKNLKSLIQTEEATNKFIKSEAGAQTSSPLKISGMEVPQIQGMLDIARTDSSLLETKVQHIKNKKTIDSPDVSVSSQVKRLSNKVKSPEYKINRSSELRPHVKSDILVSAAFEKDRDCTGTVASGSKLSTKVPKIDYVERISPSHSSMNVINNFNDSSQIDEHNFKSTFQQELNEDAVALQTPMKMIGLGSVDVIRQTGTDPPRSRDITESDKISSHSLASPYIRRICTNETFLKDFQSPSRNYSENVLLGDNVNPSVEYSYGKKRVREELYINGKDRINEISKTQKSPKIQKNWSRNMMPLCEHSNEVNDERMKIGSYLSLKNSSDAFSKFSADLESLHSPLVDKLNLPAIDTLKDISVHLLKVKTFEMLCSDINAQKTSDPLSDIKYKRASQTRSLLCKIIFERAKVQLMRMKQERLLKRVNVLSHGNQESRSLRMSCYQHLSVGSARDVQVDHTNRLSFTLPNAKVTTMKQEAEALERKIKDLTNLFHTRLNLKGELSYSETIVLANHHLEKRACCRIIRQDLQLWKLDDMKSSSGHRDVLVNYHDFIFQRFTFSSPDSSITFTNKLNDANIMKIFPNMDACTAFEFVIKADKDKNHLCRRNLALETQMTSSLLCNLLDVIEEVRLVRLELFNLTDARFISPSVKRLDLQLDFAHLKSGEKIILTLDVTSINCGVYPSDILPSQFEACGSDTKASPLLAEIRTALERLTFGYLRITRLCRCVSQLLDSSSK